MAALISKERAEEVVAEICKKNGGMTRQMKERLLLLGEDTASEYLELVSGLRGQLDPSLKALTDSLNSQDTRFIYELIQNAEDNEYNIASSKGEQPFLSFDIFPETIIVDSNEDGFTEENVRAICDINQSTKTGHRKSGRHGYIGEKGIGFKSVFRVARKVHIQSNHFSFSFERPSLDVKDAIGMITPMHEDDLDLPPSVRTRMVLTLRDPTKVKESAKDLFELQDSLLLFLDQLKILSVDIHLEENIQRTSYFRIGEKGDARELITKQTQRGNDDPATSKLYFRCFRKQAIDLPKHELREIDSAPMMLGFPVTANDEPIADPQMVYAYLPLRRAGFSFLIQSDFVTQANREDVDRSERNKAILNSFATLFTLAVLTFCRHPTLRYSWPIWLPDGSVSDQFWSIAKDRIITTLKLSKVLFSRSNSDLFRPRDLRQLVVEVLDALGEPLFRDLKTEMYISKGYSSKNLSRLRTLLGLEIMGTIEVLDRVRADLWRKDSMWKNSAAPSDWQSKASQFLKRWLKCFDNASAAIKKLELIPLTDGRWIAAADLDQPVYLDNIEGITIPTDLGFRLVPKSATQNWTRLALLKELGVDACPPSLVIQMIDEKYRKLFSPLIFRPSISLPDAVSHIIFLYWNALPDDTNANHDIGLFANVSLIRMRGNTIYFRTQRGEDEYSPSSLLCDNEDEPVVLEGHGVMGGKAQFLNNAYFSAMEERVRPDGKPFRSWLQDWAGVRSTVPLLDWTRKSISIEAEYVLKYRPEKFLGLLKRTWSENDLNNAREYVTVAAETKLREVYVPTAEGLTRLADTFLPSSEMTDFTERLGIFDFPFVRLPEGLDSPDQVVWTFLRHVGVTITPNSKFYLHCLKKSKIQAEKAGFPIAVSVNSIYNALLKCCNISTEVESIRKWFSQGKWIFFPEPRSSDGTTCTWRIFQECVWEGAPWMSFHYALSNIPDYASLQDFFRVTLRMRNVTLEDALSELNWRRAGLGRQEATEIAAIYRYISQQVARDSNGAPPIKNAFKQNRNIFDGSSKSWISSPDAVWADTKLQITGKVSIATQYSELEDFFLRVLKVQKPLDVHIEALKVKALGGDHSKYPDIKTAIILISSMNPTGSQLDNLGRAQVFPVVTKDGQKRLADKAADFAILDRKEHISAFRDKLIKLDFSLAEIQKASAFFHAVGLSGRYSSACAEESTTAEGGSLNTRLTEDFREKAYFATCCAVHFYSAKFNNDETGLYNLFRSISIYTSNSISKSITLTQYGEAYRVHLERANFHLDYRDGQLNLYVPRRRSDQEVCFKQQLPSGLFRFLLCRESRGEKVLGDIIQSSSVSVADRILANAGVGELEQLDKPDVDDDPDDDEEHQDNHDGSEKFVSAVNHRVSSRSNKRLIVRLPNV